MRLWVQSLALLSGLRISIALSHGVGHRRGSDLALLWLWHRPVATALTRLLALEPPYAAGVTLKRQKKKNSIFDYVTLHLLCSANIFKALNNYFCVQQYYFFFSILQ